MYSKHIMCSISVCQLVGAPFCVHIYGSRSWGYRIIFRFSSSLNWGSEVSHHGHHGI